ncbi:MAG: hypothetical protein ACREVO_04245 [Steroidobacteraceae bacterium]
MSFSTDEQNLFQEAVSRHFGSLQAQGFKLSPVATSSHYPTGDHLTVEVSAPSIGRGMSITLRKLEVRQALTTFLHKGQTGGFMVDTFSKQISAPKEIIQQLSLASHDGPLSERIDAVLKATRSVIDNYLMSALTGGEWPAVKVDWGDYK